MWSSAAQKRSVSAGIKGPPAPVVTRETAPRWRPAAGAALTVYVLGWMGVSLPLIVTAGPGADRSTLLYLVATLVILPTLFMPAHRRWWVAAELGRLGVAPVVAGVPGAACVASAAVLVVATWARKIKAE